jgi:hypothetical protein
MSTFALALLLSACTVQRKAAECRDNVDCESGQACIRKECQKVECLDSTSCDIGEYCDDDSYSCRDGCADDSDCVAGESCEDHQCEPYGCRETILDCPSGTRCDQTTNECYDDGEPHCGSCNSDQDIWDNSCNSGQGMCLSIVTQECNRDSDCEQGTCEAFSDGGFGTVNYCYIGGRCFVDCRPNDPDACPAGYQCIDATGLGDHVCYADCAWLENHGYE